MSEKKFSHFGSGRVPPLYEEYMADVRDHVERGLTLAKQLDMPMNSMGKGLFSVEPEPLNDHDARLVSATIQSCLLMLVIDRRIDRTNDLLKEFADFFRAIADEQDREGGVN